MKLKRQSQFSAIRKAGLSAAVAAGLALSATSTLANPNPYVQEDDSWLSINGTVHSISEDSFELDFGDGVITVEMDDDDRDARNYKFSKGDEVSVTGVLDDDFFTSTTIEARTVYVQDLGTTFLASAMDDDDNFSPLSDFSMTTPMDDDQATLQGQVTEIHDDEFVLNTGNRAIRVEVDDLDLNPLDDEGYLQIDKGDYVKVIGEMDDDLFEGREFEAERVIKLYKG